MKAGKKATLALVGTLALGVLLGVLLAEVVLRPRGGPPPPRPGDEDPFVREMERIIRPVDDDQREAIRPILEQTAAANEAAVRAANETLRAELGAMIERLEEHLGPEQIERLRRFESRPPPGGRGTGHRPKR